MRWLSTTALVVVLAVLALVAGRTPDGPTASQVGLATTPTPSASTTTTVTSSPRDVGPSATSPLTSATLPAPTITRPRVVNNGDAVVAEGNLFETKQPSEALLCPGGGWPPDVGCIGQVVVPVMGVDPRALPGAEADPNVPDLPAGTWVTNYVRVDGVWVDGALHVVGVEPTKQPSLVELVPTPEVPCDEPLGGWPGYNGNPGDAEEAWQALEAEVLRNPETYTGVSSAVIPGRDTEVLDQAVVVGTLADVDKVAPKLHSIYPYNLCIIRVGYSRTQLDEAAESIRAMVRAWDVYDREYAFGRVIVRVPVFDLQTAAALAPYGSMVSVEPIVLHYD